MSASMMPRSVSTSTTVAARTCDSAASRSFAWSLILNLRLRGALAGGALLRLLRLDGDLRRGRGGGRRLLGGSTGQASPTRVLRGATLTRQVHWGFPSSTAEGRDERGPRRARAGRTGWRCSAPRTGASGRDG